MDWGHEDGRVVGIEGSPKSSASSGEAGEYAEVGGDMEDALERVNGDAKKQWRERVSLSKPLAMFDRVPGNAIEKNPRGGGAKESHDPIPEPRREAKVLEKLKDIVPSNMIKSFPNIKLEEEGSLLSSM
jgi:hypothetical protein